MEAINIKTGDKFTEISGSDEYVVNVIKVTSKTITVQVLDWKPRRLSKNTIQYKLDNKLWEVVA